MKSNLLLNEIVRIQSEYLGLLSNLLPQLKCGHSPEVLDEINLFWVRHMGAVQLYLKSTFGGENSYVFTAATFLDYEDAEYFPFLLLGEKHILDDPLGKYSELYNRMPAGQDAESLYTQIVQTAEDNIKTILHHICDKSKLILPGLYKFTELRDSFRFDERLFHTLANHGINKDTFLRFSAGEVIGNVLNDFYDYLERNSS